MFDNGGPILEPNTINNLWPTISPLLDRLVDEKVSMDDIYDLMMNRRWLLWVNTDLSTVIVTEFIYYPQVTNLRIVLLAGDDVDWSEGIHVFEGFARINGCHSVEILGRKGWQRVLKDQNYRLSHITLSKPV